MNSNFSFCTYFIAFYMVVIPAFPWSSQPTRTYTEHTKEIIGCVSWKHPIQQRTHTPRCSLWSFLMSKGHVCRAGWKVGNLLCSQRCPSSQNSSWPRVWGWTRLTLSNVGAAVWRRLWVQGGGQRSDMGGDHPNLQGWRSANPRCWQPQGGRFSSNPHIPKWRYTPNYEVKMLKPQGWSSTKHKEKSA